MTLPILSTPAPSSGPPSPTRRAGRATRPLAAVAVVLVALLPASPAQAHDELGSSSPASGSTVTSVPRTVTLSFDEPVLDYADSTVLVVTGPDGGKRHFETTCPRIDGKAVSVPVALGASGRYTVTWRVVSDDGHPVAGAFAFTLQRPAGTRAAAGSASGPSCGHGTAAPAAAAGTSSGGVSPLVWAFVGIGGGLVVALLAVVLVLAVRRTRTSATGAEEGTRGAV
jgi:methionine-rich copper-binding protein CopC